MKSQKTQTLKRRLEKRCEKEINRLKPLLGLSDWDFSVSVKDGVTKHLNTNKEWGACTPDFFDKEADIYINACYAVPQKGDRPPLRKILLHEMVHCHVNHLIYESPHNGEDSRKLLEEQVTRNLEKVLWKLINNPIRQRKKGK